MTASIMKTVSATASALLIAGAVATAPAQAQQALTKAECFQAMESAVNFYNLAKKNTKLYPTDKHAKAGAQRYFARRIAQELAKPGTDAGDGDYAFAHEACRRMLAGDIAKLTGLFGKTALKGLRGPKTK